MHGIVTFPLDITKTRLQIQGHIAVAGIQVVLFFILYSFMHLLYSISQCLQQHRGMIGTANGIMREEGLRGLWRGLTPAILRHVVYSGINDMPLYNNIANSTNNIVTKIFIMTSLTFN